MSLNIKCVLIFSSTFFWNTSHCTKNWAKCKLVSKESTRYSCPVFWDWNSLGSFAKNSQISNFIKIRPVGAALFHAGGRTDGRRNGQRDMTRLIVAFRSCANAPKNVHEELARQQPGFYQKRECLLNSCQDGTNASTWTGIIPQNNDTVKSSTLSATVHRGLWW